MPIPLRPGRAVKATAGPSDEEVIGAIRAGDRNAFRVLVERYQARAHRLALRILRDEDAARDAVQDAFVKAYNNLGKFEQRSAFFTWLYRLVKNQCLDMLRRDRSDRVVDWEEGSLAEAEASAEATPEVDSVSFAPATELQRKQLREHIDAAIAKLPESARERVDIPRGTQYANVTRPQKFCASRRIRADKRPPARSRLQKRARQSLPSKRGYARYVYASPKGVHILYMT